MELINEIVKFLRDRLKYNFKYLYHEESSFRCLNIMVDNTHITMFDKIILSLLIKFDPVINNIEIIDDGKFFNIYLIDKYELRNLKLKKLGY